MDVALVSATIISLAMTMAMAIVTSRLLREERRRAEAQVAELMTELEHALQARPRFAASPAAPPQTARPAADLRATGGGRPWQSSLRPKILAAGAVVLLLAIVSFSWVERRPAAAPAAVDARPVELLSLDHTRNGDYLSISGTVRNPSDGTQRDQLSVTATLFDEDGEIVGAGQTPLPVAALAPDSETPFTISLPDADRVDRYRISFSQDQKNVPHVDRRQTHDRTQSAPPPPDGAPS